MIDNLNRQKWLTHFAPLFYRYFYDPLIDINIDICQKLPININIDIFQKTSYGYRHFSELQNFQKWPYRYCYWCFSKVLIFHIKHPYCLLSSTPDRWGEFPSQVSDLGRHFWFFYFGIFYLVMNTNTYWHFYDHCNVEHICSKAKKDGTRNRMGHETDMDGQLHQPVVALQQFAFISIPTKIY